MFKVSVKRWMPILFILNILVVGLNAQERNCKTHEIHLSKLKENAFYKNNFEDQFSKTIQLEQSNRHNQVDSTIIIPVVVHVLYTAASPEQNISSLQIQSQIDILNEDYGAINATINDVPTVWTNKILDSKIRFKLASTDPNGNYTTGIERKLVPFNDKFNISDPRIYSTALGGLNAWNYTSYLNIWVCALENNILGFASFPGSTGATDGVVINYLAFGRNGTAKKPYNFGRTATHEVGHWLNLVHIWGDDNGSCAFDDNIADTPLQGNSNTRCQSFPKTDACTSVSPGIMFMNYMDYTDDKCMMFFTPGQINRMRATLNGSRSSLKSSNGNNHLSSIANDLEIDSILNPVTLADSICYKSEIIIENLGFQTVDTVNFIYGNSDGLKKKFQWIGSIISRQKETIILPTISGSNEDNVFEVQIEDVDTNKVNNYMSRSYRIDARSVNNCKASGIIAYPNPIATTDVICIRTNFDKSQKSTIIVYNNVGQVVFENKFDINPGDAFPINIYNFATGIYIARVIGDDYDESIKFVCLPEESIIKGSTICN
jgi:hypothetical protein